MPRKSLTDRRAEKLARLVSIRKKFAAIESKAGERLGRLSLRAGLGELNLDDDTLLKEFEALGGRFRPTSKRHARGAPIRPGSSACAACCPGLS
ncbi:MAG: hypothetical protein J2P48_15625 [Alphaproteobacteria bacterium]|nr:hypothetical protein [Alphaproteobacteria bacterium]